MVNSGSIWKQLVIDSKARGCFFDVHEDKSLTQAILSATIEVGQIETLLSMDSPLFETAKWKVCSFIWLIMDAFFKPIDYFGNLKALPFLCCSNTLAKNTSRMFVCSWDGQKAHLLILNFASKCFWYSFFSRA